MKTGRKKIVIVLGIAAMVMLLASCAPQGSVMMLEQDAGSTFDVTFRNWSKQEAFTMQLSQGDVVRIAIQCTKGSLALTVTGEGGSQPYAGNSLTDISFALTIAATDTYTFTLTGANATGSLLVAK